VRHEESFELAHASGGDTEHLLQVVAERRRPERLVHRTRFADVFAIGVLQMRERVVIDAERLRQPLRIAALCEVVDWREERIADFNGGALRRIGGAAKSGTAVSGVVGRRALRDQTGAIRRVVVVVDQVFDERAGPLRVGGETQAKHEQPIEPRRHLLRVQRNLQRHSVRDRLLEVVHPPQLG
jgi:hypothetical protein